VNRRGFMALLGGAAVLGRAVQPQAQQKPMPVIGWLGLTSAEAFAAQLEDFRHGLGGHGFVEGRNVNIEYRWAAGDRAKLAAMAEELVRMRVDVIATSGGGLPPAAAAAATETIPIIASSAVVLVSSLARPQGNLTGVGTQAAELVPKRLELLRAAVPDARLIAVLINPEGFRSADTAAEAVQSVADAAASLGVRVLIFDASKEADFEEAFAQIARSGAGALLVMPDPFLFSLDRKIIALATRYRLPASYEWGDIARHGGLMAYGDSITALYRRVGDYTGRVLKGTKPGELPVEQPAAIRLVINLKAAKAIGFEFPPHFLDRADEVIE
jgi:putative ABC transport system substrate-binding protein